MDRTDWWATVHRVTNSQAQLKRLTMHIHLKTDSTTIVRITKAIVSPPKEALFHTFLKYSKLK